MRFWSCSVAAEVILRYSKSLSAEMIMSKETAEKVSRLCHIVDLTIVILATCCAADITAQRSRHGRSRGRLAPCPVDQRAFNDTGPEVARCVCSPGGDIRCHGGIRAVPKLVVEHLRHPHSSSFAGFYASHQQIGNVPAFAFADLSVDRILLNFNPIGHRQAHIGISHFRNF